jgi:hypothetical protein
MTEHLARIANKEVGTRESGNNGGRKVRQYQSATHLKPAQWPWCSAFVCWVVREWLLMPATLAWLKSPAPETWRPTTARAFGLLHWARLRPTTTILLDPDMPLQAGDLIVYEFSHCGVLIRTCDDLLEVAEGNTCPKGSRDGDGVYIRQRHRELVRGVVRIQPLTPFAKP